MLTPENCITASARSEKLAREANRFGAIVLADQCRMADEGEDIVTRSIKQTANHEFMTALHELAEACGYKLTPIGTPAAAAKVPEYLQTGAAWTPEPIGPRDEDNGPAARLPT